MDFSKTVPVSSNYIATANRLPCTHDEIEDALKAGIEKAVKELPRLAEYSPFVINSADTPVMSVCPVVAHNKNQGTFSCATQIGCNFEMLRAFSPRQIEATLRHELAHLIDGEFDTGYGNLRRLAKEASLVGDVAGALDVLRRRRQFTIVKESSDEESRRAERRADLILTRDPYALRAVLRFLREASGGVELDVTQSSRYGRYPSCTQRIAALHLFEIGGVVPNAAAPLPTECSLPVRLIHGQPRRRPKAGSPRPA